EAGDPGLGPVGGRVGPVEDHGAGAEGGAGRGLEGPVLGGGDAVAAQGGTDEADNALDDRRLGERRLGRALGGGAAGLRGVGREALLLRGARGPAAPEAPGTQGEADDQERSGAAHTPRA